MQKVKALIALGSNIHPKAEYLDRALHHLHAEKSIQVSAVSNFYETTPVNCVDQESFINAACEVITCLSPLELFRKMEAIERLLGKQEKPKTHPRKIDLDLLFFSDQTYLHPDLVLPHPRWQERLFVLIPLLDITEQISLDRAGQKKEFNLKTLIKNFSNPHKEELVLYEQRNCQKF